MEPKAVSIVKLTGDPDELLKWKQEEMDPYMRPKAVKHGAISQTVVKTEDGIMMINFWSTPEGRHTMGEEVMNDPEFDRILQEGGRERQMPTGYEVLQHLTAKTQ